MTTSPTPMSNPLLWKLLLLFSCPTGAECEINRQRRNSCVIAILKLTVVALLTNISCADRSHRIPSVYHRFGTTVQDETYQHSPS